MGPGSRYSDRVSGRPPHRPLQLGAAYAYGPHAPVGLHDGVHCAVDAVVDFGAGRSTADARSCAKSASVALVTYRFAPAKLARSLPRPTDAIRVSKYRPALLAGYAPKCRVLRLPVFPWRQGTLDGNMIARLKFSQPERLLIVEITEGPTAALLLSRLSNIEVVETPRTPLSAGGAYADPRI
jgi:hypothetical protein